MLAFPVRDCCTARPEAMAAAATDIVKFHVLVLLVFVAVWL
jgi:hypothetical protein